MNVRRFLSLFVLTAVLILISTPLFFASAQTAALQNPLQGTNSITDLLQAIIHWMILIGAPIAVLMIIYGATEMLFAGGNPEKFKKGKNVILYAVIGYGIITIGWGIVSIIEKLLQ